MGMKPQSKLWKLFSAASCGGIQPSAFGGIVSNNLWLLDNSAKKLQCALLLKFKPHYNLQILLRCVCNI
jgi:hypothetical protein